MTLEMRQARHFDLIGILWDIHGELSLKPAIEILPHFQKPVPAAARQGLIG